MADVDVDTVIIAEEGDVDVEQTFETEGDIDALVVITDADEVEVVSQINVEKDGGGTTEIDAQIYNGDFVFSSFFTDTENAYVDVDVDVNPHYDYSTSVSGGGSGGMSLQNLAYWLREGVDIINGESGSPRDHIAMILNDLAKVFATKAEVQTMYANEMGLHYRLLAVERTLEELHPDEFCESKLEVMRDYDLPGATCGDWSYSISNGLDGGIIIGIKNIPMPEEPPVEPEPEPEPEPDRMTLEVWEQMCDQGMQKWCLIAQQYKEEMGIV